MSAVNIALRADPAPGEVSDALDRVESDGLRVVLNRDGHPVAAIVPMHDLRALEELDEAEDAYLSSVAAEAVAQWESEGRPPGISHKDIARELGIDLTPSP